MIGTQALRDKDFTSILLEDLQKLTSFNIKVLEDTHYFFIFQYYIPGSERFGGSSSFDSMIKDLAKDAISLYPGSEFAWKYKSFVGYEDSYSPVPCDPIPAQPAPEPEKDKPAAPPVEVIHRHYHYNVPSNPFWSYPAPISSTAPTPYGAYTYSGSSANTACGGSIGHV